MAVVATIPRLTSSALPNSYCLFGGLLLRIYSQHFPRPSATDCAIHGASLSLVCPRESNQREGHPGIRVSLRSTSLLPVPLRGPAYKGRPCPFKPLAASMRLVPLRNTSTRPADGEFARMRVSRFRRVGVVGSHHHPLIVPTLCVGMQPQTLRVCGTQSVPGGVPTQSVATIENRQPTPTNPNASTTTSPAHPKLGPGSGPVRRLSGIVV